MGWTIEYAASVRKTVAKLDPATRRRLRDFLETRVAGLDDPRSLGQALSGPLGGLWRYRVGDWRIICDIRDRRLVVLVLRIGRRREVCR
ncbi:MAG: type II toxin-antitoxin system mRNA interferase toxin, RelE/StbE family [Rhodospirillales bacterium CG15_BIG_FIL_POST_REV_8_21_14_020_66_15]|nr:MAG: type II toxin-antitoxin system mRNA interferase toxin, RelE/StbE family [Rhodospirillales bacterium CG15_BIG_FIL_POST_REV_8_21_14_020_66_15]